jgi:hypothetical protein
MYNICRKIILNFKANSKYNYSDYGVVEGFSGLILAVLELYEKTKDDSLLDYLNELLDTYDEKINIHDFGYGSVGFLWILDIINKKGFIDNTNDYYNYLEPVLIYEFKKKIYANNVDYFDGAVGILFYFLSKDNADLKILQSLVDQFVNRILKTIKEDGWYKYELYKPTGKLRKVINYGVPHGITGIVLILLKIKEKNYRIDDNLIKEMVNYLIKGELIHFVEFKTVTHYFPTQLIFNDSNKFSISGLAWCYGDLMAGYAILKAGKILKNDDYYNYAIKILENTLLQEYVHTQKLVLCHGYTSLSHIYIKIFQITGIDIFLQKADYWEKVAKKEFLDSYKQFQESGYLGDYFENPSLFFGFPGFILSVLKWEKGNQSEKEDWLDCLLL